jgi:hypothetical protein
MKLSLLCREGENLDAGTETNANLYHELCYHFVGTDQSEDIQCWRDSENPKYMFGAGVTDDGKVYCECSLIFLFSELFTLFWRMTRMKKAFFV